jgi:hypothetical protein
MPFTDSGGFVAQTDEGARGVLLSHASCSAPIVEAWHGRDERWVIPIGDNIGSDPPQMSGTVTTCRGEARRRLAISAGLIAASLGCVVVAWLLGRKPRNDGLAPAPG